MSAAERRMAKLLTLLIEHFEDKHYALKAARPLDVLNKLMSANNLKQKDLLDVFGTPSIVSEVLHGKRQFTMEHIAGSAGDSTCRRKSLSSSENLRTR